MPRRLGNRLSNRLYDFVTGGSNIASSFQDGLPDSLEAVSLRQYESARSSICFATVPVSTARPSRRAIIYTTNCTLATHSDQETLEFRLSASQPLRSCHIRWLLPCLNHPCWLSLVSEYQPLSPRACWFCHRRLLSRPWLTYGDAGFRRCNSKQACHPQR